MAVRLCQTRHALQVLLAQVSVSSNWLLRVGAAWESYCRRMPTDVWTPWGKGHTACEFCACTLGTILELRLAPKLYRVSLVWRSRA